MATIRYEITDGLAPFTVGLYEGFVLIDDNIHGGIGEYYFTDVDDGNYVVRVMDATGCYVSFNADVNCVTTTTVEPTTTEEPTTTSEQPTTSEEPTTTAETTTTIEPQTDYGFLYNWWAVIGDKDGDSIADTSIASEGWHVPSIDEWVTLRTYTGGNPGGYKCKLTGYEKWNSPNTGATNELNFNAVGSGVRSGFSGNFSLIKQEGGMWASEEYVDDNTFNVRFLFYNTSEWSLGPGLQKVGYATRLIKDTTDLEDGETGTYTGNNGITYSTICIGTQEWLACNLEETKFRDGTNIPYIDNEDAGDDATWAAATSAAYCIYPIDETTTTTV